MDLESSPSGTDTATASSTTTTPTTTSAATDPRPDHVTAEEFFSSAPVETETDAAETEDAPPEEPPTPDADPLKSLLALPNLTPAQRQHLQTMHRRSMQASAESKTARANFDIAQGWHQLATRLIERAKGAGLDVSDVLEGADPNAVQSDDDTPFDLGSETNRVLGLIDSKWYDGLLDQQEEADRLAAAAESLEAAGDQRSAESNRKQARQIRSSLHRGMMETAALVAANLVRASHGYHDERYSRLSGQLGSLQPADDTTAVEAINSAYSALDDATGKQRYADLFVPGQRKFSERGAQLIPAIFEAAAARGLDPRDPGNFDLLYSALSAKHPAAKPKPAPTRVGDASAVVDRGAPAVSSPRQPGSDSLLYDAQEEAARRNRRGFGRQVA